jgi:hypothetical protein
VAAGAVLLLAAAAVLGSRFGLFGEQTEHLVHDESAPPRAPDGDLLPPITRPRALVWAVGDADAGVDARVLATTIERTRPDRVLYLGDVYEHGDPASFRSWDRIWGRLAARTAPTPGNHDWNESREGYDPYWLRVHGSPLPTYYRLEAAGWEILSVNSEAEHGGGSEQARWLASEVTRPSGDCRIVFWHRPRFSAGPHGDQATVEPLWTRVEGHARILLGGHEHNLQRLRPRSGVTQFVVGAGGRGHAALSKGDSRLAFANDTHTGALRLVLEPGRASWAFVAVGGRVLDTGRLACSGGGA